MKFFGPKVPLDAQIEESHPYVPITREIRQLRREVESINRKLLFFVVLSLVSIASSIWALVSK